MQRTISRPRSADSGGVSHWQRAAHPTYIAASRWSKDCYVMSTAAVPVARQQKEQALSLERVIDGLDIDSVAAVGFHGPDDVRGLVASEAVRSAALVTVPIRSTLAVSVDGDGGQLSVLAPPEMPPNIKKAIEVAAGLICDTPDYQLVILAVLLLWARKYGSTAWREYCEALLPPQRELSCLLCYSPGELSALQLPHLVDEASRQHDWARWVHSQWLSAASGALRRLGLAEGLQDTTWALALARSRAVEFQMGLTAGSVSGSVSGFGSGSGPGSGLGRTRQRQRPPGPVISVLAPVVDLANHSNDPNCVVQLTTDRSRVVLLPRRPVAAGEPLTVDYGFDRSSLELMADYGFITSANPYDGDVTLPGADKLPSLELPRLEAAARVLLRRRDRQRRQQVSAVAAVRGVQWDEEEAAPAEVLMQEAEVDDSSAEGGEEEEAEEAQLCNRLKAAVTLLAPRTASFSSTATVSIASTPATQRIIAGLWHKLVRHCVDSLPTSLEQDRAFLDDIVAGRISGFMVGPDLTLDPTRLLPPRPGVGLPTADDDPRVGNDTPLRKVGERGVAGPTAAAAAAAQSPGRSGSGGRTAVTAKAVAGDDSFGATDSGEVVSGGNGTADEEGGEVGRDGIDGVNGGVGGAARRLAAAGHPGASSRGLCRTGRHAGRLYAAVRGRVEHKELLLVAEELLLLYGRN